MSLRQSVGLPTPLGGNRPGVEAQRAKRLVALRAARRVRSMKNCVELLNLNGKRSSCLINTVLGRKKFTPWWMFFFLISLTIKVVIGTGNQYKKVFSHFTDYENGNWDWKPV